MDRSNIDKIAKSAEDRRLLARLWDKISIGMQRNTVANTCFLSPRELEMAKYLFGNQNGLCTFGGYPDSERNILVYLPDYLEDNYLTSSESPIVCLRADFYQDDTPTHRDFLGSLIGSGISRDSIGDICVGKGFCYFFVSAEIAQYLLDSFIGAGRTRVHLSRTPLEDVIIPNQEIREIKDTLASLRLDSVISSGFRIGRHLASQYVTTGKAAIDGLPCEKPDRLIPEGAKISVRGLGKIMLFAVNGTTKKDRISVTIHHYI